MRLRSTAISLTIAGLLAGCAQKPLTQPEPIAPNPFGYLKRSAVCSATPLGKTPEGLGVAIKTRSDDGLCSVSLSQPEGGAYASFLLSTLPSHGKSFIYNYNKQTIVTYTAATAYAGMDSFVVGLVPGTDRPRTSLKVDVAVDNTGVAVPPPPVIAATPAAKSSRHRRVRHPVRHPKASASSDHS